DAGERVINVVDGEHDAQVSQRVHRRHAMVGRNGRSVETRQLEATVTVGRAQHRDLDALAVQARDAPGPVALDGHAALEHETELGEEPNCDIEVFHDDAHVVHTSYSHVI